MRRPSTFRELYGHWLQRLSNPLLPVHEDEPQCGYYRTRWVKGGPWVPVEVYCVREIDDAGDLAWPEELWARIGTDRPIPAVRRWTYFEPITRETFDELMAAHTTRPDPVLQATHAAVDLSRAPVRP